MQTERHKRVQELEIAGGQKGLTVEQAKPVYFKDGRVALVQPDGSSLVYYPNGGIVLELADGTIEQLAPYGSK
jgi:hypothetical protein